MTRMWVAVVAVAVAAATHAASALATPILTPVPGSPYTINSGPVTDTSGSEPADVAFSPSGSLLASANAADGTISVFSVGSNGALTQVSGSPFDAVAGVGVDDGPLSLTFNPSGSLLAVANSNGNSVSIFAVGSNGSLTAVAGSPFSVDDQASAVAFNPAGTLLAVIDDDFQVLVFSVASDGSLTPVPGSPFEAGVNASLAPAAVSFSPTGGLLAIAGSGLSDATADDGLVSMFSVAGDGALSAVSGSPFATGTNPLSVDFNPAGTLLATANYGDDGISVLSVGSGGALTQVPGSPFSTGSPGDAVFNSSGTLLATADEGVDSLGTTISLYSVGTGGALTEAPCSPFTTDSDPQAVAFSPSGAFLADPSPPYGTVSVFAVSDTGAQCGLEPPKNTVAPVISGTAKAGVKLACSTGSWTNSPTGFTDTWADDGTTLAGETTSSYTVPTLEEGTTLTCAVTASNSAGSATAASAGVTIPIPHVANCPGATGKLSGTTLGLVKLGATRAEEHKLYRHHSDRGSSYKDFFCLTPIGVRVGYGSPKLLSILTTAAKRRLEDKVVWASTSNPYYSIGGVRPGESIAVAAATLHTLAPLPIGLNDWYLAVGAASTDVLKVRGGVVQEIGIATNQLTRTAHDRSVLMHSFY